MWVLSRRISVFLTFALLCEGSASAQVLLEYRFTGNTNDSSGSGIHGDLVGDATIQDGRLFLPGDLDNGLSIPLGDRNPFGGDRDFTVAFDFQSVDGSTGALFSSDGAPLCEDLDDPDACYDGLPGHPETGDQRGSLNIFMWPDGTVATDFWFIDSVVSELFYNDDEVHSYHGSYDSATGEYIQTINGEDITSNVFLLPEEGPYLRDASADRNFIGDETSAFGVDFNFDGFNGFFDNVTIETPDATIAKYEFEGDANDSSGENRHGQLVGEAAIDNGRLRLPGGIDNGVALSLDEDSPFGGDTSWTLSFEFQTVDGSTGPLFAADGSPQCDEGDFDCEDLWPEHEENGDQSGSLNVFLSPEGELITDFWFIDGVGSEGLYNDDQKHTYVGTYNAETGEFTQVIDGEDEAGTEVLVEMEVDGSGFMRDTSQDRTLLGDESNVDFGFEFNPDGFNGYFDNLIITAGGGGGVPSGDFNGDGELGVDDLNQLSAAIASGENDAAFDLNADTLVDAGDLTTWIVDLKGTWFGDANLDGEFNTGDFVDVFQKGKYETREAASWDEGDWNGDGQFTSSDFIQAFQDAGFEQGLREAQTVPEPTGFLSVTLCLILVTRFGRGRPANP